MSFKKITDIINKQCKSPEHSPPGHIVLHPGIHKYTCPQCGKEQIIIENTKEY